MGYKLSVVDFNSTTGDPVARSDSNTSATDILINADNSKCPKNCFRPVGVAFDGQGRLFMSSDASGEIYVVMKENTADSTTTGSTGTGSAPAATSSKPSGAQKAYDTALVTLFAVYVVFCISVQAFNYGTSL